MFHCTAEALGVVVVVCMRCVAVGRLGARASRCAVWVLHGSHNHTAARDSPHGVSAALPVNGGLTRAVPCVCAVTFAQPPRNPMPPSPAPPATTRQAACAPPASLRRGEGRQVTNAGSADVKGAAR